MLKRVIRFAFFDFLLACLAVLVPSGDPAAATFVTFESGQVRPLALSPDGLQLFAVNTPDNHLEIYDVNGGAPTHVASVPVGMEPVAVAIRPDGSQAWVVNHLSDSVSVVDLTATPPRVIRTLLVGDEPRDIVFAGGGRAFITTAHRGQNTPLQPTIDTVLRSEGIGRADVWVFDPGNLGVTLAGTPLTTVTLFGDTPRALAVSPDGNTVYAAVFHSGNQTTTLNEAIVCNGGSGAGACNLDGVNMPNGMAGGQVPGGLPAPNANFQATNGPEVGLIVKFNESNGRWEDVLGRNWTNGVRFSLPDLDVFAIDADAPTPTETASFAHVGTVLFNMIANPVTGRVYVSNTDARNEVRFEGPGIVAGDTVRGHLHEARITVLDGVTVTPRHLNKHITTQPQGYRTTPMTAGVEDDSLATPMGMAITSDGATLYVAAFGSSKVAFFNTAQLENNTFTPNDANHITVTGGGPSGLVLDDTNDRLYVFTRFDNSISVINTNTNLEIDHLAVHNPEPASVVDGRPFLYDARFTSSNGEASCSSCHIFGDFDSLAWDLGNPDDIVRSNPNPGFADIDPFIPFFAQNIHPMKGPMTTQTLRGMDNHGPMHWRGDRTGAYAAANVEPDTGGYDEDAAFKEFNVAFEGLLGRDEGPLAAPDMQAFTDFILQVVLPPNPIRDLGNALSSAQQSGSNFYFGTTSDGVATCNGCHELNASEGFFGANARSTFENETQEFKVAHLRNMYQKVGMFGMPQVTGIQFLAGENADQGPQVRGFGFLHDGGIDTIFRFHRAGVFSFPNDTQRRNMESFMFAFDTTLAPIVGQQITLTSTNGATVDARIDLLIDSAEDSFVLVGMPGAHECDLILKGVISGEERGFLYDPAGNVFDSDRAADAPLTDTQLRNEVDTAAESLTYTCAPPGSGLRMGLDRDEDTHFDRDEIDAGSDPADPGSIPGGGPTPTMTATPTPTPTPFCDVTPVAGCRQAGKSVLVLKTAPGKERLTWKWLKGVADLDASAFGTPTSSTRYGLCLYSNGLHTELDVLPSALWKATGSGFRYLDTDATQDGVKKITLRAGDPGKGKTLVKGKGSGIPFPPLSIPMTVQLRNSQGECWEAVYTTVLNNDGVTFKTKF